MDDIKTKPTYSNLLDAFEVDVQRVASGKWRAGHRHAIRHVRPLIEELVSDASQMLSEADATIAQQAAEIERLTLALASAEESFVNLRDSRKSHADVIPKLVKLTLDNPPGHPLHELGRQTSYELCCWDEWCGQQETELATLRKDNERLAADLDLGGAALQKSMDQNASLRERVAELEVVVGKLPVTADGVPAYHGMKIWRRSMRENGAIIGETLSLCCDPDGGTSPEECYSTRESAIAAAS